jgi:hypothetical protein
MDLIIAQGNLKKNDFWKCGICQNCCIISTSYKPKEIITLNRSFWKELSTEWGEESVKICNTIVLPLCILFMMLPSMFTEIYFI